MATLTIAGVSYPIAPYKLAQLEEAAPIIDAINARAGSGNSMEGAIASASEMSAVLAIGLRKEDPEHDVAWLKEQIGFGDMAELTRAFTEVMVEAGLASKDSLPGEQEAPVAPEAAGA